MDITEKIPYDCLVKVPTIYRWLVLVGIIFIIGVLYYLLYYAKKLEHLNRLTTDIVNLEGEYRKNIIRKKKLPELKQKIAALNQELFYAKSQLPVAKEIPELLAQISSLGTQSGLEFLLFKPISENKKEFYTEIPVEMKVSGPYHAAGMFLDKIGRLTRIVNVTDLAIEQQANKDNTNMVAVSCKITTFMLSKATEGDGKDAHGYSEHRNYTYNFSFLYPFSWVVTDAGTKGGKDNLLIISDSSAKGIYIPNITISINNDRQIKLGDFLEIKKKEVASLHENFRLINEEKISLNEHETATLRYKYTFNGAELESVNFYIAGMDNTYYILNGTALLNEFKDYSKVYNKIAESFTIFDRQTGSTTVPAWLELPESKYNVAGIRDPFKSPFGEKSLLEESPDDGRIKEPLELFELPNIKLIGLIQGSFGRKAMLETPDGKGYVVDVNSKVGKRDGVVKKIMDGSILIEEKERYRVGADIKIKSKMIEIKLDKEKKDAEGNGQK